MALALGGAGFLTVASDPAAAVVVYDVTTTADEDDGACAADADCTLREAIGDAAADGDASEIQLDTLTTYPLTLCTAGDLDHVADEDLTITGNNATITQTCANERVFDHDGDSLVTLSDLTISGGQAASGGGVIRLEDGSLTVANSFLHDNEATGGGSGGAIDALGSDATVTVMNSAIRDNVASDTGGAIRNIVGTTIIEDSTISGNAGAAGGAIQSSTVTVHNSTITANEARDSDGGGVLAGQALEVVGSTIVDNTATQGGANLHNLGSMTVEGSIIADGHGRPDCGGSGLRTSDGYNVGGDDSCDLDAPTDAENVGPALLAPLNVVSGPTPTRVPLAGSPAQDHVPNAVCTGVDPPVSVNDQRGILRPRPTATDPCDAGAVEGSENDLIADALVKRAGKPFVGAGIFSTEGGGQKATLKKKAGKTATYVVRARNASPVGSDQILLEAAPSTGPFRVRYFDGTTDVTSAVTAGGHATASLTPGAGEKLKVKVKVRNSASPGDRLGLVVTATPSSVVPPDAVKMITKAK